MAGQPIACAHLVLPAVVLAAVHAAAWSRYLRAAMRRSQPTAVHRGGACARRRRARARLVATLVRPALLPVMTVVLLDVALLAAGAVVTESVFAWPGLGSLFTEALARRDYAVLMALLMLASTAVVAAQPDRGPRLLDRRSAGDGDEQPSALAARRDGSAC